MNTVPVVPGQVVASQLITYHKGAAVQAENSNDKTEKDRFDRQRHQIKQGVEAQQKPAEAKGRQFLA
jgi:hypothetical protein